MMGTYGYTPSENNIFIFINPQSKNWQTSLKSTIAHEYAHAVTFTYHKWQTLLDSLIFEGLAESFKEKLTGDIGPKLTKAINENQSKKTLLSIKNKGETLSEEELNILKKGLEQTTTYLLEHYFSKEKTFVRYDSKGKKLHSLPKKQWEKYVSMVLGTNNSINSHSETEQRSNYIGLEKLTDLSHNAD